MILDLQKQKKFISVGLTVSTSGKIVFFYYIVFVQEFNADVLKEQTTQQGYSRLLKAL